MTSSSPWHSRFARRTYLAGALWVAGVGLALLQGEPDRTGWLAVRLDPAGLLYLAAAITGSLNFASAAGRAVRRLRLDMNVLMLLAITGAILIGEPFEAATLSFLFSVAELLERHAVSRGRRSIAALVELAPERAERILPDGMTESVPVARLVPDDRIRVRPGDKIAADGVVIAGRSTVNEATITGESLPVGKGRDDRVFAGTMNGTGALDVRVTADAEHSTIGRIATLVREAESRRAPIEQTVQRFARYYTPIVTVAAFGVMLVPPLMGGDRLDWFLRGLIMLVIACPCAFVIATPVTMVSALTTATRHGVLVKGAEYLEVLGTARAFALDKTGTLTTGRLSVTRLEAGPGTDPVELTRRVAAAEARSEHPVAAALVRFAEGEGLAAADGATEFEALPGQGIRASVAGQEIRVGHGGFIGEPPDWQWPEATDGMMRILARTTDGLTGAFFLRDEPRPDARDVVTSLHRLGLAPIVVLSGDAEDVTRAIGAEVGADQVRGRLLPEQKVEAIRGLLAAHGSVVMLGDGVNDAPALAEASVGMAMGAAGAPAAIEAADVALMADDLSRVPVIVRLARQARRTVRVNIAVALGLKFLLAVAAVLGVASLAAAVLIGDVGGSVVVTLNALRLGRSMDR